MPVEEVVKTDAHASLLLQKLIAQVALECGFESISSVALVELEAQCLKFVAGISFFAHQLCQESRRTKPNARDVFRALQAAGFTVQELLHVHPVHLPVDIQHLEQQPPIQVPEVPLLPFDEYRQQARAKLAIQPDFFPTLPPQHLWKQTPIFPEGMKGNKLLDQISTDTTLTDNRVRTARLVEASLRNLIRSTTAAVAPPPPSPQKQGNAEEQAQTDDVEMREREREPVQVYLEELPTLSTSEQDRPRLKLNISTHGGIKVKEQSLQEHLVHLQMLASTNPDESMDASIVNWQTTVNHGGLSASANEQLTKRRGLAAFEGSSHNGKVKVKWTT